MYRFAHVAQTLGILIEQFIAGGFIALVLVAAEKFLYERVHALYLRFPVAVTKCDWVSPTLYLSPVKSVKQVDDRSNVSIASCSPTFVLIVLMLFNACNDVILHFGGNKRSL